MQILTLGCVKTVLKNLNIDLWQLQPNLLNSIHYNWWWWVLFILTISHTHIHGNILNPLLCNDSIRSFSFNIYALSAVPPEAYMFEQSSYFFSFISSLCV